MYLGYHTLVRCKVCLKKGSRNISNASSTSIPTKGIKPPVRQSTASLDLGGSAVFKTTSYVNNDNLMREFYYLREFRNHPHITKLYEIIFTESSVYMILEYYPSGDLFEYVTKVGRLSVDDALRIFAQVLGAVFYLHKNGCCHRDLKLENVLLDKHNNVKLSDFGFTREIPFSQHGAKALLSEYCGTGAYMAPEIVKRIPYNGIKIDIWALGVMFYTMLTGEMPFDDSLEPRELEYAIVHDKPRFLEDLECIDAESVEKLQQIKDLLSTMLCKDAEDRISSLEDVLKLPLFEPCGGEKQIKIVNKLYFDAPDLKHSWSGLTTTEKALFKSLVNAGIDREVLKKAIQEETLDTVYGLWALLNNKYEKKEKKSKRRSVLRLSRSKSLLGNARQVFSASPVQSDTSLSNQNVISSVMMNPNSKSVSSKFPSSISNRTNSIRRSSSLKKVRSIIMAESDDRKNFVPSVSKEGRDQDLYDQGSILSKSTQRTSNSKKSENKIRSKFSLRNLFKSRRSFEDKWNEKIQFNGTSIERMNGTINTGSSNFKLGDEETKSITKRLKEDTAIPPEGNGHISIRFTHSSEDNVAKTPQQFHLKRTEPTTAASVNSNFSAHSSISDTSNGSGYITGYSTDINMHGGMNGLSATNSNIATNGGFVYTPTSVNRVDRNGNANSSNNLEDGFDIHGTSAVSNTHQEKLQLLPSPQTSNKPKFSRGISDWSTNMSSQAESPNSSYVTLSRSNSVDSLSRTYSGRKKKPKSADITVMARGRSPLNSKMNTKWAVNTVNMMKTKHKMPNPERQTQIIEEESSEDDEPEEEENTDIAEDDEVSDFVNKSAENFNKLRVGPPPSLDNPLRSSRLYMRKKSMRFPPVPITEESSQDLASNIDDDYADVEEDIQDYDDDIATQFSIQESRNNSEVGDAGDRPLSPMSGNSFSTNFGRENPTMIMKHPSTSSLNSNRRSLGSFRDRDALFNLHSPTPQNAVRALEKRTR